MAVTNLSWDLHLHPGPSSVPRWGDGARVWAAARDAGVRGFVWKSHEDHTVERCLALPPGPPWAIPSVILNPWTRFEQVIEGIDRGALWVWGPSRSEGGLLDWELELPPYWPHLRKYLHQLDHPVALATSHLAAEGRLAFAEAGADLESVFCTATHSQYLPAAEMRQLASLGCAFEFDLYTAYYPVKGRPSGDLMCLVERVASSGALVYLTSDAGQEQLGDPFSFSSRVLDELFCAGNRELVQEVAVENPIKFVAKVLKKGRTEAAG